MMSVPKFGNPPLPWKQLPPWLRFLRVLLFAFWGSGMVCLTALFILQNQVLSSPTVLTGVYTHPVGFKGGTFYLAEPFFSYWIALNSAYPPLWVAGFLLIIAINNFEYRIKRRQWDTWLGSQTEATGDRATGLD